MPGAATNTLLLPIFTWNGGNFLLLPHRQFAGSPILPHHQSMACWSTHLGVSQAGHAGMERPPVPGLHCVSRGGWVAVVVVVTGVTVGCSWL